MSFVLVPTGDERPIYAEIMETAAYLIRGRIKSEEQDLAWTMLEFPCLQSIETIKTHAMPSIRVF